MARSKAGSHREDDRRPVREPGTPARARADWTVVAVFAAALVSVLPVIVNEFANDDILLIETNERIQQLSRWREIFTMPYWPPPFSPDLYRPLLTLAHVVEYLVGGAAAVVFRVVSMLLFAGVAACLYRFVEERTERVAAIGAVALFIVHPVHVETVTLAVAQNEIAIAFLALASTWFYVRHRAEGRLTLRAWTALATMYAAAALLKESGFVLPAFWAAAEFTLVERPAPKQVWPGFAAMAVLGAGLFGLRARVLHDPVGTFQAPALVGLDARGRALTMLSVVPQWLRLLVFPAHLRADYSPQEFNAVQTVTGVVLLGAGILGGAVFAAVRYLGSLGRFGLLWIAIALLPVSNVVIPTGILITERSLFLPSVGAVIILAEVFTRTQLFQVRYARPPRRPWSSPASRGASSAFACGGTKACSRYGRSRMRRSATAPSAITGIRFTRSDGTPSRSRRTARRSALRRRTRSGRCTTSWRRSMPTADATHWRCASCRRAWPRTRTRTARAPRSS
jgi:hypothetical protein